MTRGGRICLFSSFRSRRLADVGERRRWTRTSSTTSVCSTARQSQCLLPAILRTISSRCHLSPAQGSLRRIRLAERLAEFQGPLPHSLVADDDAACGQHLLDHAQAEREAEIQPDGMADDLSGKPLASVAGESRRLEAALE